MLRAESRGPRTGRAGAEARRREARARTGRSVLRGFPWWRGAAIVAGAGTDRGSGSGAHGPAGPRREVHGSRAVGLLSDGGGGWARASRRAAGRGSECAGRRPCRSVAGRARRGPARRRRRRRRPRGGGAGGGGVGARGGGRPGAGRSPAGLGNLEVWPARLFQLLSVGPPPEKSGPPPVPGQSGAEATPRGSLAGDLDGLRGPETCRLNFAGVPRSRAPRPTVPQFPEWKVNPLCRQGAGLATHGVT